MRWLAMLALVVGPAAAAPAQSNPAFLGIGPFGRVANGCMTEGVAAGGAAAEAGIQPGDIVLAMDGIPLGVKQPCDQLVAAITAHVPGDAVRIDILRGTYHLAVTAALTTRADVLQNNVGRRLASIEVTDIDDPRRHFDLVQPGGRAAVIGFTLPQCGRCARVFERVAHDLKTRAPNVAIRAVLPRLPRDQAENLRKIFGAHVSLSILDNESFGSLALGDPERVFFVVIDRSGGVALVAPIAPDSDDLEASIDDVFAAANQAAQPLGNR